MMDQLEMYARLVRACPNDRPTRNRFNHLATPEVIIEIVAENRRLREHLAEVIEYVRKNGGDWLCLAEAEAILNRK